MRDIETPVVGAQYLPGAIDYCRALQAGVPVTLEHDPENKFDNCAVKVIVNDVEIGFLPNKGYSCSVCWAPVDSKQFVCKECSSDLIEKGGVATRLVRGNRLNSSLAAYITNVNLTSETTPIVIKIVSSLNIEESSI